MLADESVMYLVATSTMMMPPSSLLSTEEEEEGGEAEEMCSENVLYEESDGGGGGTSESLKIGLERSVKLPLFDQSIFSSHEGSHPELSFSSSNACEVLGMLLYLPRRLE